MENEMGGSFVCINYLEFDDVIKEIVFQQISKQKYILGIRQTWHILETIILNYQNISSV